MVLSTTTDKIDIVLGGSVAANQLRCVSTHTDVNTKSVGRTVTLTNNTTDVTLVPAPSANRIRQVDYISVYNQDTANASVTIKYNANGTEYTMWTGVLGAGERLEYVPSEGWNTYTNQGSFKSTISQGNNAISSSLSQVVLGSDVTNNNGTANTIADVTGLSFPVTAGNIYWFRFIIRYTSAATTTGSRWSVSGPGSPTFLTYKSEYSLTSTSLTINEGLTAYDLPAASNATSAATAGNIAIIEGFIQPSANGTVIARFASEIASSAIVAKAGSMCYHQQIV